MCTCKKCTTSSAITVTELEDLLDHYGDEKRLYIERATGVAPPINRCSIAGKIYAAAAALRKHMEVE